MEATYDMSFIPLEKIDLNPFYPRHTIVHDNSADFDFDSSIAKDGLLEPIVVRRAGDRYQIISGHRRFGAFWRLHEQATEPATRERFASIPACVRKDVQDVDMLRLSLIENLQRHALTALEIADALTNLRKMSPSTVTVRELADLTGLGVGSVSRYLDLAKAPPFIREALEIPPPVSDVEDAPPSLTVGAALELVRYHNALAQIPAPNAEKFAEKKAMALLHKAQNGCWSISRLRGHVDELLSGKAKESRKKTTAQPPVLAKSLLSAAGIPDRWTELLARVETFWSSIGWYAALVIHFVVTLLFSVRSNAAKWMHKRSMKPASAEPSKPSQSGAHSAAEQGGPSKKAA